MKTRNSSKSQWVRHMSRLLIAVIAFMSVAGSASARILFQDDDFDDVASEGIIINFDDGGDEDVTLQFGNDSSDATIIFDDGDGDMTFATPGGDFSFSDDNITTTGDTSTGGLTTTGTTTLGDGSGTVAVNSTSWDVSTAGVASGFTGFTSTGTIDFSGASRMAIHSGSSNPATCTEGDIFYNTTGNTLYVCTATDTWTAQESGADDFESVYAADADNTLTTSNGDFTVATGTGDFIVTSANWSVDAAGVITGTSLTDGTATLTGGSLNGLTGADGTTENTIEALIFDADAEAVTGVWTWADNVAQKFGTGGDVLIQYDEANDDRLEISGTNADVWFEDSIIVETNATVNGTLDANGTVTLGDGGDTITINSSSWDVSSAGVASGFTGFTSTGAVDFKGTSAFNIRENSDPAGSSACTAVGELIVDTTDKELQICTSTGTAGNATWTSVSDGGNADTLDNLDSLQFLRSDTSDNYTSGTLTFNSGTELDTAAGSTVDVNGIFDASGSTEFRIRENSDPASNSICTTTGEIIMDTTDDEIQVCTSTGSAGNATWVAADNDFNVDTMTWEAEYPDVVVYDGDTTNGNSHKGKLEGLYDATNDEQYYHWSTKKNEDEEIDLRFRYELPADFIDAGNLTLDYRTLTATTGDNTVQVIIRNDTDDQTCHTDTAAVSTANTWGTLTITGAEIDTGCTGGDLLAAGDVIEVIIRLLADDTNSGWADVGTMSFAYTN